MPSIAPFVAAFRRRLANLPGPLAATGEASNGEPAQVELLVGGVWVDITSYCLVRDNNGKIDVTYGIQGGEGSQTERGQAKLQLRNQDGRFSPRNPMGPYYDSLVWRNAQMRVSVPDGMGGKRYLIWGEVSEWAPGWEGSGNDVWTDVTINGILQRLAQGPVPERSVIYNAVTTPLLTGLVAYWPCEDPTGSIQLASGLTGGSPMTWTGTPVLAGYDGFGASDPVPTLTGASLNGGVIRYDTSGTQYQLRYLLAIPTAGFSDLDVISRITVDEGAYSVAYMDIHYNDPPGGLGSFGGKGTLTVLLKDGDENDLATSGTPSISMDVRSRQLRVSLEASDNGTALAVTLRVMDIVTGATDSTTIGLVSTQTTRVASVSIAPATLAGAAGLPSGAAGHVMVQNVITDITDLGRAIQPAGEPAGRRMQRLCGEEGIAFDWVGDLDDTVALGPQGRSNLIDLVQEAVLADGGLLYENTDVLGLGYRTRASLFNQDPALVLSYPGFNLAEVPVPLSDDRYVQNRVTVTVAGVSQTYEQTDGPLGTAAIGVYGEKEGVTLNLATQDAPTLLDQAAWRVHLGTVYDERFPEISVNLAHPSITPDMRRAVLGLRLGDRVQITGMPGWLAPDTVDQMILGKEQTVTHFEHRITFTCAAAYLYNAVAYLDDGDIHLDTDSLLLAAVGSADTKLVVVAPDRDGPLWSTDDADAPWEVRAGGENMRVTANTSSVFDNFTRTASNGWGTANTGQAWSVVGTAADYAVGSGIGTTTLPATGIAHITLVPAPTADVDLAVNVATSVLATGNSLFGGPIIRAVDNNNHYQARLEFTTAAALILTLRKRFGGTETVLGTYTMAESHVAGTYYRIRIQAYGAAIRARVWNFDDLTEPTDWHITATDASISTADSLGTRGFSNTGNTNVNPVIQYDFLDLSNVQTLTVVRSTNGVVKSHSAGESVVLAHPPVLSP